GLGNRAGLPDSALIPDTETARGVFASRPHFQQPRRVDPVRRRRARLQMADIGHDLLEDAGRLGQGRHVR
ncbi:hypothetical protein, partial [Poseidonocella sp. HB161398]|uniref:hypothetical protein n=1 Tax=Poseidonocella sp. HB161398 TaxID=2320855 RepID=UPI001980653E